jgi:hypothetical protein
MLNVLTARQLLRRGETADSYLGVETTSIVTTTISDEALDRLSLEDEIRIIEDFRPDYWLPADAPTYTVDTAEQRIKNVRDVMTGTAWICEAIADRGLSTTVIPLVKGVTPAERGICYEMFDRIGAAQCGFYVGQFFTSGDGVRIREAADTITAIVDELATGGYDQEVLVVGALAPQTLKQFPRRVTAAAGLNTWRSEVEPRGRSDAAIRQRYAIVAELVESALGSAIERGERNKQRGDRNEGGDRPRDADTDGQSEE